MLYELAERPSWERVELRDRLGMDASFLTRVLARLQIGRAGARRALAVTTGDGGGWR